MTTSLTPSRASGLQRQFGWRRVLLLATALLAATAIFAAPIDDYRRKQEALDAELAAERYALGLWALQQKLTFEAREEFERVLQLNPGHKEAAARLAELTAQVRRSRNPKCEFHMITGESVKADLLMSSFRVQTPAGFLLIPTTEIDLIELGVAPKADHLLSDAYTGEGQLKVDVFQAQAKVGAINVKRVDVKAIRIFRPCAECEGAGQMTCRRCSGTGRLAEKSVCPDCAGKGRMKCKTCDGKAKIICPLCGGSGRISGAWGRFRRIDCPRCRGGGTVDCPDCDDGSLVCPTCKAKPASTKAGPCPVCNGAKVTQCAACGGTGNKPLPRPETEEPKPAPPEETPAPAPPVNEVVDP